MTDVYTYDAHYEPLSELMVRIICSRQHGHGEWRMHPVQAMMTCALPIKLTISGLAPHDVPKKWPIKLCDRVVIEDIAVPEDTILYELDGDVVGMITRLAKPEGM